MWLANSPQLSRSTHGDLNDDENEGAPQTIRTGPHYLCGHVELLPRILTLTKTWRIYFWVRDDSVGEPATHLDVIPGILRSRSHFDGHLHIEDFLDWIRTVENFFDYSEIAEEQRVKVVAYKLKGGAFAWWEQLQYKRKREGKRPIRSWSKMRRLLKARFLPADYEQMLYQQFQQCRQRAQSVTDYTEEFYRLSARVDLAESEPQQVARYIGGLKEAI